MLFVVVVVDTVIKYRVVLYSTMKLIKKHTLEGTLYLYPLTLMFIFHIQDGSIQILKKEMKIIQDIVQYF